MITVLCLFATITFSQGIFYPVTSGTFAKVGVNQNIPQSLPSIWVWRISATITADELVWNKETKNFLSNPLSAVGPAIGYRHFVQLSNGTIYNDFGINAAALLGFNINDVNPTNFKGAIFVNCFQYINIGVDYDFSKGVPGILLGANINL